mgnify:CR=1 FL=1
MRNELGDLHLLAGFAFVDKFRIWSSKLSTLGETWLNKTSSTLNARTPLESSLIVKRVPFSSLISCLKSFRFKSSLFHPRTWTLRFIEHKWIADVKSLLGRIVYVLEQYHVR